MPKERKPIAKKPGWTERIPAGVALASSVVGLISATGGLWLLWPKIVDSLSSYRVSYDYIVVPEHGLSCVAKNDATLKLGDKSIGLLQNSCQKRLVSGVARNDVFRAWYVRVANAGPVAPKVSVVQAAGTSDFSLSTGDVTLACLGFEGRTGRESKAWDLDKLVLSDDNGKVRQTITARTVPTEEQLKSVVSDCAAFVGYPPLIQR
ncbi:hypothetical protein RX330_22920 [Bradyrhizobium sp. NDS-1]|uniref:hypothetical protein n=1 Tax=Bradyrhizobium sp. NDS-1 TaxID=3080014 RepID=UPI00293E876E|nr:hypothetical protein [Bradyrhizobium sp. NDS-1]WOH71135.1 hypothetical protein RX330_22920 [Bradyrhizobium sp. NDS-1]